MIDGCQRIYMSVSVCVRACNSVSTHLVARTKKPTGRHNFSRQKQFRIIRDDGRVHELKELDQVWYNAHVHFVDFCFPVTDVGTAVEDKTHLVGGGESSRGGH